MGKAAWIACLCSSFLLLALCCPARTSAKQAASAVQTVRKSHKHHASTNKLAGLKAAKRGRANSADRLSGRAKRGKTAKLGGAATRVHATATNQVAIREEEENSEYMEYRVKRGDTVEKLARLFQFERDEFTDLNGVRGKRLKPGTHRIHSEGGGRRGRGARQPERPAAAAVEKRGGTRHPGEGRKELCRRSVQVRRQQRPGP